MANSPNGVQAPPHSCAFRLQVTAFTHTAMKYIYILFEPKPLFGGGCSAPPPACPSLPHLLAHVKKLSPATSRINRESAERPCSDTRHQEPTIYRPPAQLSGHQRQSGRTYARAHHQSGKVDGMYRNCWKRAASQPLSIEPSPLYEISYIYTESRNLTPA